MHLYVGRLCDRGKPFHRLAVLIQKELGKIPFYTPSQKSTQPRLEVLEHRMGVGSINLYFLKQRESNPMIDLAGLLHDIIAQRLLLTKLIAWKT